MWPDSDETKQLLNEAGEGDADAVNRLMERHRQALRQMVQARLDRALAGRVDASDVVQDVLLEAHRRLKNYIDDPAMPFHLWLRQLAKDQLIDTHRRHRLAQRRSLDREQPLAQQGNAEHSSLDLAAQLRDQELTPAAATLRKEFQQRFYQALEQLEEDDRELILMRHVEQLSNSDIAQALGLSQPAAGMRHLRALRRLREILGDATSL